VNSIDQAIQQAHLIIDAARNAEPGLSPTPKLDSIDMRELSPDAPRYTSEQDRCPSLSSLRRGHRCILQTGHAKLGFLYCQFSPDDVGNGSAPKSAPTPVIRNQAKHKDYMSIDDCREVAALHFERLHPGFAERYADGENLKSFIVECAANVGWECAAKATRRAKGIE
jgi:hypothetical protein